MRKTWPLFLLFVILTTSCTDTEVQIHNGGQLSAAERQNLLAIHSSLKDWNPSHSALWNRDGVVRHICLFEYQITSITAPYEVFVFGSGGTVLEANYVHLPQGSYLSAVKDVSPFRVSCMADGHSSVVGLTYPSDEGRRNIIEHAERSQRIRAAIEVWERSGSTNSESLKQILFDMETNSPK